MNRAQQRPYNSNSEQCMPPNFTLPRWALNKYSDRNTEFWCDTCDRGFNTRYLLDNHKKQHEKCNIDGCQFIAHPKVITRHIQMQHSTGLYNKIAKLQDPEEIRKWREERKNKYPTKLTIERKNAEYKEKIERGEKMGMGNNKNNRRQGIGTKQPFSKDRFTKSRRHNTNSNKFFKKPNKNKLPDLIRKEDTRVLKPFGGIKQILLEDDKGTIDDGKKCNIDIMDDDWLDPHSVENTRCESNLCGALTALIGNYGSSDEENEEQKEIIIKPNVNNRIDSNESQIANNDSDDGPPEETGILRSNYNQSSDSPGPNKPEISKKSKSNTKYNHKKPELFKRKVPSTLLQKLLKQEINHERNVVLQCVHYIVNKKYFRDESK